MDIPAYRLTEIESRQHRFQLPTPAERKARRKRFCEAVLIIVGLGAFAACFYELSSRTGAALQPAPVITADNSPVRWQRKDFQPNPSPASVSQATTITRRGFRKSPAPGIGSKRKAK